MKISRGRFYSLFSLGVSGALICAFAVLDPIFSYSQLSMAAWISAYWAMVVCAIATSIQELSGGKTANSRRSFVAIIQILIALCILAAGPWVVYESMTRHKPAVVPEVSEEVETAPSETKAFDKFNLSYTPPAGSWVKVDPPNAAPNLLSTLYQANPAAYFQILAESGIPVQKGQEKTFTQFIYAEMMKPNQNKIIAQEPEQILGIDGFRFDSEHSLPNTGERMHRIHWMGAVNGYFYQLSAFASSTMPLVDLRKIFDAHVKGITFLEKDKSSKPQSPAEDYRSSRYPYIVHVKDSGWLDWWIVPSDAGDWSKQVDYKLTNESHAALLVYPILFEDEAPPLKILSEALVHMNKLSYEKIPPSSIKPVKQSGYEGLDIDCENKLEDDQYFYRIRILRSKNLVYFVTAFKNTSLAASDFADLEKGRSIFEALKPEHLPDMKSLDASEKARNNEAYLWIAKTYHEQGEKNTALSYLQKAFVFNPEDDGTLFDILRTYEELKLEKDGVLYADKYKALINSKPSLKKKFADLVSKTPDWKKAQAAYEELIKEGKLERGVMYSYLELMKQKKIEKEAYKKVNEFAAASAELETRLALAVLLQNVDQDKDALKIFDGLYERQPRNSEYSDRLFYHLLKMQLYEDVVSRASKHIKDYGDSANIYYYQGIALIALKRYDDARVAFSKAREIEPEAEDLKRYADGITGLQRQSTGRGMPYDLDVDRSITFHKDQLDVQETLKFSGSLAAAWKESYEDLTDEQKKNNMKDILRAFYGKFELKSLEVVASDSDRFEIKITYTLSDILFNAGSKHLFWLPRALEWHYLVPKPDDFSDIPLSVLFPLKIHGKAVLKYTPADGLEIGDLPAAKQSSGCLEVQSQFSPATDAFQYDATYTFTGGPYLKTQVEQCQNDVTSGLKKSLPAFLVKKDGSKA